jgi:antitoxin ParD1/3/4
MASGIEKRTFSLPAEHAAFIDELVESGAYASGSEVVRAGLRALKERDKAVERWLREEAASAVAEWKSGKEKSVSLKDVSAEIRQKFETSRKAHYEAKSRRVSTARARGHK